jgi:hypothetical protein
MGLGGGSHFVMLREADFVGAAMESERRVPPNRKIRRSEAMLESFCRLGFASFFVEEPCHFISRGRLTPHGTFCHAPIHPTVFELDRIPISRSGARTSPVEPPLLRPIRASRTENATEGQRCRANEPPITGVPPPNDGSTQPTQVLP